MSHPSRRDWRPPQPAVRNAADRRDLELAELLEDSRRHRFRGALERLLQTVDGRIVLAALIRRAGVMRSIWDPSSAIHYNAGRQDYGHELVADVIGIDGGDLYDVMERAERQWSKSEQQQINAHHARRDRRGTEPAAGQARTSEDEDHDG